VIETQKLLKTMFAIHFEKVPQDLDTMDRQVSLFDELEQDRQKIVAEQTYFWNSASLNRNLLPQNPENDNAVSYQSTNDLITKITGKKVESSLIENAKEIANVIKNFPKSENQSWDYNFQMIDALINYYQAYKFDLITDAIGLRQNPEMSHQNLRMNYDKVAKALDEMDKTWALVIDQVADNETGYQLWRFDDDKRTKADFLRKKVFHPFRTKNDKYFNLLSGINQARVMQHYQQKVLGDRTSRFSSNEITYSEAGMFNCNILLATEILGSIYRDHLGIDVNKHEKRYLTFQESQSIFDE